MNLQAQHNVLEVWKEWVRLREGGGHGYIQEFVEKRLSNSEQRQAALVVIRKWELKEKTGV
mgnify:CR=1 FL=1